MRTTRDLLSWAMAKELTKNNELVDGDYLLADRAAWFTVDDFSIRIYTVDEGVFVDIYKFGYENRDAIAGTYAFYSELEEYDD